MRRPARQPWLSVRALRKPAPHRVQMPPRDPRNGEDPVVRRGAKRLNGAELLEQCGFGFRSDSPDPVQHRLEAPALALAAAARVREAVRFVASERQHEELRTVRSQWDRIFLSGEVNAVDHPFAELVLFLLRETDDAEVVDAEVVGGGERDAELAATAVNDEEIGELPVGVGSGVGGGNGVG
jgi:hypothetical protein